MSDDTRLLESDKSARAHALDTTCSYIVQAPAGSGKTELLIQRYLKLLGQVKQPEEVLAITFTRKAALEMQLRVFEALQAAGVSTHAAGEHRQLTLSLAKDVLLRDEQLGWRLVATPRRLRIQTLDALNAGIARSLPISSGLGGAGTTLADEQMRVLYREAAAATLDWLTTDDPLRLVVETVLSHLDNNTALYVAHISRMLATRDQWLHFTGAGIGPEHVFPDIEAAARDAQEACIARLVQTFLVKTRDKFPSGAAAELVQLAQYALENLRRDGVSEHALYGLPSGIEFPTTHPSDLPAWQALAEILLTKTDGWRRTVNKKNGFPVGDDGEKKAFLAMLERLAEHDDLRQSLAFVRHLPDPNYSDEQWQVLVALINLLPLAVVELQQKFSASGVTDHIEVARAAGAALGGADDPGDIALLLDYRIQHLLVDEMQDTSIGQYKFLELLTAGWQQDDGRTLFCVGDPMQSIYRFRDADVSRFLLAQQNGIGSVQPKSLLLRRNFRSGEHLVHWFNTVFQQIFPRQDDPLVGAVSYAESVPVKSHEGLGECHVHALFDADTGAEAEQGARVIERCLTANTEDSVVVLVRSRTQLPRLLWQLRRSGIRYQAIEIDRLTDLPEVADLLALTRALCHRSDRLAWLALLRGPWVGLRWQDLHALVCNDKDTAVPDLLRDEARVASLSADAQSSLKAFFRILRPISSARAGESLRDRIERAWFALGGPAMVHDADQLENVYRYFEVIEKIEVAGSLADVRELEERLDHERVSTLADDNCKLQIMTMHRAKGLQFDHVILYGLGRTSGASKRSVLNWLTLVDDNGDSSMVVSSIGARAALANDRLHHFIEMAENEKERVELDRLLYVACTRAIRSLHLIGHVTVNTDKQAIRGPRKGSLLWRLWPVLEPHFVRAFELQGASDPAADTAALQLVAPTLKRLVEGANSFQAPELPCDRMHEISAVDAHSVEYYWVGAAARHAGTIVHRHLQGLAEHGPIPASGRGLDCRAESRRLALHLGVPEGEIESVCDRVDAAIEAMLNDRKGRWLLEGDGHAELALTGLWQSRTESIVIDRVRVDGDGTHWIVDYKTSTHEGGDLATFLRQEQDRYRPQLEKYIAMYSELTNAPVKAALYFPLLQEFCEVRVQRGEG